MWQNGKYVAPALIEKALHECELFTQVRSSPYVSCQNLTATLRQRRKALLAFALSPLLTCAACRRLQILVYGSDQPYNVALVVPNWDKLHGWAIEHADGIAPISSKKEVGEHPKVPPTNHRKAQREGTQTGATNHAKSTEKGPTERGHREACGGSSVRHGPPELSSP